MALFDRTAGRLARGPAVLFPADPDGMAEAVLRYDPAAVVKSDRFAFHNGVELYGPVEVTTDLAIQAGLPGGQAAAGYYAAIAEGGTGRSRPDSLKWQDAERLIRGLAARLGGTVHDERPPT